MENRDSSKVYIACSMITFGIIIIAVEFLKIIIQFLPILNISNNKIYFLFILIHIISSAIGSYLLTLYKEENKVFMGISSSIIAYILEYVYVIYIANYPDVGFIILIALVFGGIIGILISRINLVPKIA